MPPERPGLLMPEKLERWLKESVGISRRLLLSLGHDDDWTFVIKMHGIIEAALNHLLLTQFDNPELAEVVPKLETNNLRTGKMAFIKAYKLLPENACLFVKLFSEVRNRAVHDIKNFDLNLVAYLGGLDSKQQKNWKTALTSWMVSDPSEVSRNLALLVPREAIYNSCMMILLRSYEKHTDTKAQKERIRSATKFFEGRTMFQGFHEPDQSTPTV
jgi:hypothetical protein